MGDLAIGIDDVRAAAERLRGVAHRTPVITARTLDARFGGRVFLKAENLQRVGAFKFRGAYNAVTALAPERGVVTASSGNHAQALALAARLERVQAVILMPKDAPPAKRAATEGYGAEVLEFDRYRDDRDAMAREVARDRGRTLVHPYDDPLVMAGQGTAGLEILEDVPNVDLVLVQVGGGGLVSGIATAVRDTKPDTRVVAIEPERSRALHESMKAGEPVTVEAKSIADGLNGPYAGANCVRVCSDLGVESVLVTEEALQDAFRFMYGRMKLACEVAGAATAAALMSGAVQVERGQTVAADVSGGN